MGKKKNGAPTVTDKEAETAARRDAVHKAIEALGPTAPLPDLAAWVKENAGIDVDNRQVGLFRYHMLPKKPKAGKKRGRKPKAHAAPGNNGPAVKAKAESPVKGMVAVNDLRVVKGLVGRYGQERIREMLDFLAE